MVSVVCNNKCNKQRNTLVVDAAKSPFSCECEQQIIPLLHSFKDFEET